MIITQISAFKKAVGLFPKSILLPFEKKYISSLAEKEMPTTKKAEVVAPAFNLVGVVRLELTRPEATRF